MVGISIGFTMVLFVISLVAIVAAGIKSLMQGKMDGKRIVLVLIPILVFGLSLAFFGGDFPKAGVFTAILLFAVMVLTIGITGLRGTFK